MSGRENTGKGEKMIIDIDIDLDTLVSNIEQIKCGMEILICHKCEHWDGWCKSFGYYGYEKYSPREERSDND